MALNLEEHTAVNWLRLKGGRLHPYFRRHVKHRLAEVSDESIRTLWTLAATDELRWGAAPAGTLRFHQIHSYGVSAAHILQEKFFQLIQASLRLEEPNPLLDPQDANHLQRLVKVDVQPWGADDLAWSSVKDVLGKDIAQLVWPVTDALRRIFELLALVRQIEPRWDASSIFLPSISRSGSEDRMVGWARLAVILRECWDELASQDSEQARVCVALWEAIQYPLFKRLQVYARTHLEVFDSDSSLAMVQSMDDGWALWNYQTQAEVAEVIRVCWRQSSDEARAGLIDSVLRGPPREMYPSDLTADDWQQRRETDVLRRLRTLEDLGASLPEAATSELERLKVSHGDMSALAPVFRSGKAEWVRDPPIPDQMRKRPYRALLSLAAAAHKGKWQTENWKDLFKVLQSRQLSSRAARCMAETLADASDEYWDEVAWHVTGILREVADKNSEAGTEGFWKLWDTAWKRSPRRGDGDLKNTVSRALNRPLGKLAEAAVLVFSSCDRSWGEGLTQGVKERLELALEDAPGLQEARVRVATYLWYLFAIDPEWTRAHLLPWFNWSSDHSDAQFM